MFKPLFDRVLIRKIEQTEIGGILIPETARHETREGIVIAVGTGKVTDHGHLIEIPLKPGDRILYAKYGPHEVEVDGEKLWMAKLVDILGVFEE